MKQTLGLPFVFMSPPGVALGWYAMSPGAPGNVRSLNYELRFLFNLPLFRSCSPRMTWTM